MSECRGSLGDSIDHENLRVLVSIKHFPVVNKINLHLILNRFLTKLHGWYESVVDSAKFQKSVAIVLFFLRKIRVVVHNVRYCFSV
jgi:hypothetical protein